MRPSPSGTSVSQGLRVHPSRTGRLRSQFSLDGIREALAPTVEVRALSDLLIEQLGYGPRSQYVEVCSLPVLGRTATWLYRRLGTWAEAQPDGSDVDLVDLGVSSAWAWARGWSTTACSPRA